VEIRVMTKDDYDEAAALWKATPHMGLGSGDDSREGVARYLERNPGTSFVAVEDGRVIGTILGGHDGRRGFLYHTAVAEERQGRGVGRELVAAAVEAIRRQGVCKIGLLVYAGNDAGAAFWEKEGFGARGDLSYRDLVLVPQEKM